MWLVALAAGIVCVVPRPAGAQQIGGTVTDASGAILPGVTVEARSYNHLNIRPLFSVVVTQAVTDSLANQKPTIMGYRTSH